MADAADDDLVDYDDDDVVDQTAADDKDAKKGHYVGTCVEINECVGCTIILHEVISRR